MIKWELGTGINLVIKPIGTICVYDENGKLIMEKTGLTKEAIKIIEENFLDIVVNNEKNKTMRGSNDPMYI